MKKLFAIAALLSISFLMLPAKSLAAGGIFASGGGKVTVGQTFTITVSASGATFDTFESTISVSGPVSISSFNYGDTTYIGAKPANGVHFVGTFLGDKKTSFSVATIKLKATGTGSGAVSVSSVALKNAGSVVGTGSSNANFTIEKAPDLPGKVSISSTSHPDQATAYEATTIVLAWEKTSGVDGFSYLLDQTADTTPSAKITDANTTVSYADKAIGTYFFHIRAHKADGWGTTSHFKINIKEPDAKVDELLAKPSQIKITRSENVINNLTNGTLSGIIISGKTEPGFTANLALTPAPTLPEGKTLTAIADESGNWSINLDYPIASGYHKLTVQGQKEKILTPLSDEIIFEISQKEGGTINILTSSDELAPVKAAETPKQKDTLNKNSIFYGIAGLVLIALIVLLVVLTKRRRLKWTTNKTNH